MILRRNKPFRRFENQHNKYREQPELTDSIMHDLATGFPPMEASAKYAERKSESVESKFREQLRHEVSDRELTLVISHSPNGWATAILMKS